MFSRASNRATCEAPVLHGVGLALVSVLLLSPAALADRGVQHLADHREVLGGFTGSHALLIGVSSYQQGWEDLQSIPEELAAVERVLKERHGFDTEVVLDPDSETLNDTVRQFINDHGFDPDHRLIVFFSGHGYTMDSGRRGFVLPADTPPFDPARPKDFLSKAIPMSDIIGWARKVLARHVLFVFDSCFSGTIFDLRAGLPEPAHVTTLTTRPVRQFITAGRAGDLVPARSRFTPAFVEALGGAADLTKDGYVTGSELAVYLNQEVATPGQVPQYGRLQDIGYRAGDFVFEVGLDESREGTSKTSISDFAKLAIAESLLDKDRLRATQILIEIDDPATHRHMQRQVYDLATGYLEQRRFGPAQIALNARAQRAVALPRPGDPARPRIWHLDSERVVPIEDFEGLGPEFGEGDRLFWVRNGSKVILWDLESGRRVRAYSGHTALVLSVELSSNGKFGLSTSEDGTVRLWKVHGDEERMVLGGLEDPLVFSAFLQGDSRILTSSSSGVTQVWSVKSRALESELVGHEGPVDLATPLSAGRVLTAANDGTARIWDQASGEELDKIECRSIRRLWDDIFVVEGDQTELYRLSSWSRSHVRTLPGRVVALNESQGLVLTLDDVGLALWNSWGWLISRFANFEGYPHIVQVVLSEDGLRTMARRGTVLSVWNSMDGSHHGTLPDPSVRPGFLGRGSEALFTVSGTGWDQELKIWRRPSIQHQFQDLQGITKTRDRYGLLRSHPLASRGPLVWPLTFSPVSPRLFVSSSDGELAVIDTRTHQVVASQGGRSLPEDPGARVVAISLDGETALLSLRRVPSELSFVNLLTGQEIARWPPDSDPHALRSSGDYHDLRLTEYLISPDHSRIALGANSGAFIWSVGARSEPVFFEPETELWGFSADGNAIVSASGLWDASTGEALLSPEYQSLKTVLAVSPDWSRIVADRQIGRGPTYQVLTAGDAELVSTLDWDGVRASFMAFDSKGDRLLTTQSSSKPNRLRIWDTNTGAELSELDGTAGTFRIFAFSPDGSRVVGAGRRQGTSAVIWSVATGKREAVLDSQGSDIVSVAFSPTGQELVTAGLDRTVRIWSSDNGTELLRIQWAGEVPKAVFFDPDGARIAVLDGQGNGALIAVSVPLLQAVLRDSSWGCLASIDRQQLMGQSPPEAEANLVACRECLQSFRRSRSEGIPLSAGLFLEYQDCMRSQRYRPGAPVGGPDPE